MLLAEIGLKHFSVTIYYAAKLDAEKENYKKTTYIPSCIFYWGQIKIVQPFNRNTILP